MAPRCDCFVSALAAISKCELHFPLHTSAGTVAVGGVLRLSVEKLK